MTLTKEPGAPKETHVVVEAQHLFDVHAYVDDFNREVMSAYRANAADVELPADGGVARSIIPPGTAATRDFSHLAPRIPEFIADRCVGCMSCVNACPDTAIFGVAIPKSAVEERLASFAKSEPVAACAAETAGSHFVATRKYGEVPAKRGLEPALFGIFVDPVHCKGCAECVEVCVALGYDALRMVDKVIDGGEGEATLDRYARDMRFFRSLPPTPREYRNEKALADLMLGELATGYVGGAGSCSGCGEATAIRMLVAATRQTYGAEGMGIVASTGCNTVFGSTYPYNPYLVPWTNSLFENAPADAMGIRARWDQMGWKDKQLWVIGGDGAMLDIGFQSLSRMLASGMNIKVLVIDTQVYSNTGGQSSTASYMGQNTKFSVHGSVLKGKIERRKELAQICMMHPNTFVAQTSCAMSNHFYKSIIAANEYDGPAVVSVYTTCQPEHGVGDNMAMQQSKLAVDTRTFPVLIYDPRKGDKIAQRLSLQGNPSEKTDFFIEPKTGEVYDFIRFARTEGRFAKQFDKDGNPSETLIRAKQERLDNWHTLQELAGII